MIVGSKDYQLTLSRLAMSFQGTSLDSFQGYTVERIRELSKHSQIIADEIPK